MSNKLKVQELRDELAKRGLDTSGAKPALVVRLDAAILDEQKSKDEKILSVDADLAVGRRRGKLSNKQSTDEDDKDGNISKKAKSQDANNKINPVVGVKRKQKIIDKISTLKDDNETTACKRQKGENISNMSCDDLRQELATHGLSTSGTKKVLVERLSEAMKEGSSILNTDVQSVQGYNAEKLPLGKLSKLTILKGYEVLKRMQLKIVIESY